MFDKVWDKNFVSNEGDSEDHQLQPLQRNASTLVVVKEISLLPIQASKADGVVPGGVGVTRLYIEADASAGKAL
jgi:hypothetical protein